MGVGLLLPLRQHLFGFFVAILSGQGVVVFRLGPVHGDVRELKVTNLINVAEAESSFGVVVAGSHFVVFHCLENVFIAAISKVVKKSAQHVKRVIAAAAGLLGVVSESFRHVYFFV